MAATTAARTALGAVAALLALAGGARGQEAPVEARARAALPPAVYQEVAGLAAEAAREGVPVAPLYDKALEGVAKGVPPQRIVPAVRAYGVRLRDAHRALGGAAPPGVVVAAADALRRGLPAESLGRLGPAEARSPMAYVVLGDLVEAGVPVDRALGVVGEALGRRAGQEALLEIPLRLRALMRQGRGASSAADQLRRMIRQGRLRGGVPPGARRPGPPTQPGADVIDRPGRRGGRPGGRAGGR